MLPTRQQAIRAERELIKRRGLTGFVKRAWPSVMHVPLIWGWHIDLICYELEQISLGKNRKLFIGIPPGCMKTLLTGVFWPAWEWTLRPKQQWIYSTYGSSLTLKAARQMRSLVNSDWYQRLWPDTKIPFQNTHAAAWFENNHGGFRFSGSTGGEVTGRHANKLVGDDLNKAQDAVGGQAATMTALNAAWDFWSGTLPTRQSDPSTTCRVLIGQRIHRDDVPGRWIRSDKAVRVVSLPMRMDRKLPHLHPMDMRDDGELLWPERFGEKEVKELEMSLGPTLSAAQLQQDPVPPGGRLLVEKYLKRRWDVLPSRIARALEQGCAHQTQRWLTAWDLTFKGKSTSDYVVGQLWCSMNGEHYLIDQVRGQMGFQETIRTIKDFANKYHFVRKHIVEDAANAAALEDTLKSEIHGLLLEPHGGGCLARTQQVEGVWAAESVILPADAPWMGGGDGFVAEHLAFDGLGTRHDDQVAASSLALCHLTSKSSGQWLANMKRVMANA